MPQSPTDPTDRLLAAATEAGAAAAAWAACPLDPQAQQRALSYLRDQAPDDQQQLDAWCADGGTQAAAHISGRIDELLTESPGGDA